MSSTNDIFLDEVRVGLSDLRRELKLGEQSGKEFDKATQQLVRYSMLLLAAKSEGEREQVKRDIDQIRTTLMLITATQSARVANKIIETTWSVALKLFMTILV